MFVYRKLKNAVVLSILILNGSLFSASSGKSQKVFLEHLNNGMTYCLSHQDEKVDEVEIKLMVKFNTEFQSEKEKILSIFVEKLFSEGLNEKAQRKKELETTRLCEIILSEPKLYQIPNVILYGLEIFNPSQEVLDYSFSLLCDSLESLKEMPMMYEQESLSDMEIKEFINSYYRPENLVLFVSGNFSHLAVVDSIKNIFSPLLASKRGSDFYFGYSKDSKAVIQTVNYPGEEKNKWLASPFKIEKPEFKNFEELPLLNKEEETIQKIMNALASSSIPRLIWKQKELEKMGKSINHVHPLKFISFIINEPILRSDLQEVHRNFFKWRGFLDGFRRRMTEEFYKGNLKKFLPGFCESVCVKEEVIDHFIEKRDWEGLVKSILY